MNKVEAIKQDFNDSWERLRNEGFSDFDIAALVARRYFETHEKPAGPESRIRGKVFKFIETIHEVEERDVYTS